MKEKSGKLKRIFKPTKKKVIITVIVLVVLVGGISYVRTVNSAVDVATAPLYDTAIVEKKDLTKEVSVNGTIGSADTKTVLAEVSEVEVTQVNVEVGDKVKAGDVICVLDSSTIETKLESTKSDASLASQKSSQSVSEAQSSYNNAVADKNTNASRNAQAVTDTYNGYQTAIAERDGAKIEYEQAQTNTQTAKTNYETLLNTPDADPGAVETALAAYQQAQADEGAAYTKLDTAQAKVEAKEAEYKTAVQTQEDTALADERIVAQQSSSLSSAKLDAQSINSGDTALTIDELEKQIDACTVVAPIDGTITALNVEEGDIYKGTEIAVIQDEDHLLVNATVDQYTISDIEKGMSVIIKTDTTGEQEMPGTLSFVSPVPKTGVDSYGTATTTTDYEIQADFSEQNERLRLGMNAKTTIIIAEAKNVLSVPGSYIQTDGDRSYVTVLLDEETGETEEIDVTLGLETDYDVEVSGEGLEEGMQIIIPESTADGVEYADAIYG